MIQKKKPKKKPSRLSKAEKKRMLRHAQRDALRALAHRMTVALGPPQGIQGKPIKLASGFLLESGGRTYVATALHYLGDVPVAGMTIMFPPDEWATVDTLEQAVALMNRELDWTVKARPAQPINAKGEPKRSSALEDIALIEIDRGMVPDWCVIYNLDRHNDKSAKPTLGEQILVAGVPSQSSFIQDRPPEQAGGLPQKFLGRIALERFFDVAEVRDPDKWGHREFAFDPKVHFALIYDQMQVPSGIEPDGLSGGGLWRIGTARSSGKVGKPVRLVDPILVGVQSSYRKDWGMIKATSVARLRALIRKK